MIMTSNITCKDFTYNIQHTWWVVFKGSETFLKMNKDCTSYRIHSSSNIDMGNFPYKRENFDGFQIAKNVYSNN